GQLRPAAKASSIVMVPSEAIRGTRVQRQGLLHSGVLWLRVEVHIIEVRVPLTTERAGYPGLRVVKAPDGERDARLHGKARLQHPDVPIRSGGVCRVVGG